MDTEREYVQLFRTTGTTAPTSDILYDGEVAVGMNPDLTRLWHKKTDDTIAEYLPKDYIESVFATKDYVDNKDSSNSYKLVLNDDGSLECIKNETGEGFVLNSDGSLGLS